MNKLTILSAVTVLSMMAAAPASAEQDPAAFGQFAQQNPSASAAMYPNANIYAGVRPREGSMGALAFLPPSKRHAKRHVTQR